MKTPFAFFIQRTRVELHGGQQFWYWFLRSLRRHRKRGNVAIPPLGAQNSWHMGQCARFLVTGRRPPRYILRALAK
jgi:hypothetical protein